MQNKDTSTPGSAPELPADLAEKHGLTESVQVPEVPVEQTEVADALEQAETDAAVDAITHADDALLLDEIDAQTEEAEKQPQKKPKGKFARLKAGLRRYWSNPYARWGTIIGVILLVIGLGAWPTSRYAVLNTFGVRATTTLRVVDNETRLPLKNVTVSIGENSIKTNGDGQATLRKVRLGKQDIHVERVAFAPVTLTHTIGWGSNPLDDVLLDATGLQLQFAVSDYLSEKPVTTAEARVGEASAIADDKGIIHLSAPDPESATITVEVLAKDYKTQSIVIPVSAANERRAITLLPAQEVVYISKQSGKFDVYKADAQGEQRELLLAGTGNERRDSLRLVSSPDGSHAALVSTRGVQRDADQFPMSTLTLLNVSDGAHKSIDLAQRIEPLGWSGDTLIYMVTYASASAANSERNKLIAYNTDTESRKVLATADYFNGAYVVGSVVYYATTQTDPSRPSVFAKVGIDGSGKGVILDRPVWSVMRTSTTAMSLETQNGWYDYTIGDSAARRGSVAADYQQVKFYSVSADGKRALWVDNRDGKGVIILSSLDSNAEDRMITSGSGITQPVRWLSSTSLLYRVANGDETADYVVSIEGGEPRKVTDVTNVSGFYSGYGY